MCAAAAERAKLDKGRAQWLVLLGDLLPEHVIMEITDPDTEGLSIVHYEPSVSVLFCDIRNFTDLVELVCVARVWQGWQGGSLVCVVMRVAGVARG
jgi:hypothetical protein